jgi:lipoprotein-anchoring transpeptidase ErfK/SrfK
LVAAYLPVAGQAILWRLVDGITLTTATVAADQIVIDRESREFSMLVRLLAKTACVAGLLVVMTGTLTAGFFDNDPEERMSGGAPRGKLFGLFGYSAGSPIPRSNVSLAGAYNPGTIIINTTERRLYLVTAPGQAIRYGIGVGRVGFAWAGTTAISVKKEWPDWTPPSQMLKRRPDLPRFMKGGIENPLGARAMYLGSSLYRIHGSNEPETIGQAVSSGCFRMTNEDVVDLYSRVNVGTKVIVQR